MSAIHKAVVAAAVFCALVFVLLATPAVAEAAPPWSDLPASTLETYGLTQDDIGQMSNGYLDGTWRPSIQVTRGQFARLALGYFGIYPVSAGFVQRHFSDVPQSSPHYAWVETALEIGLVSGYQVPSPTTRAVFGLYDPITREQAIVILARYLSKMDPASFDYSTYTEERCNEVLASFSDEDQVTHRQEVAMAIDAGVLRGSGTALAPKTNLTRIQAAALIVRTRDLLPPPTDEPPLGNPHVLDWLFSDAYSFDITAEGMQLGRAAPWMPRTLTMKVRLEAEEDPTAYQETAELLAALAEQYRDEMKYEEVRVVMAIPGGAWVYDHTFKEAPDITYPPINSAAYYEFFSGFSGDGYDAFTMKALREGDLWVIRVVVRIDADRQKRETYDAIYDYAATSAKDLGVAAGESERLRIVLAKATPIPPMGLPEEIVLEQRDFDLSGGEK